MLERVGGCNNFQSEVGWRYSSRPIVGNPKVVCRRVLGELVVQICPRQMPLHWVGYIVCCGLSNRENCSSKTSRA